MWRNLARTLQSSARTASHSLAASLLPSECWICNLPLDHCSGLPVCTTCLSSIHPQHDHGLCQRCATRLDPDSFAARQYDLCDECREDPPAYEKVIAFGEYTGELRELVHLLKFRGVFPAASLLARHMAKALEPYRDVIAQPVLITAVPLFAAKLKSRGFNQSCLLASELARVLRMQGWNVREDYDLLSRSRATRSQSELNLRQRRANLRGVFTSGPNIESVRGQHVLLVDDIVTTAATARHCAKVLSKKGAKKIWVAAAARSQKNETAAFEYKFGGGIQ